MMIGMGLYLSAGKRSVLQDPAMLGFASNATGNPTMPTHSAGDLIVALGSSSSSATPPTAADAGGGGTYTAWGSDFNASPASSMAAVYMVAIGSSHTIEWTGASGVRAVWVFEKAEIDTLVFTKDTDLVTLDWPNLSSMAENCIVCTQVIARATQSDIATAIALGGDFTERVARNTSTASWVGDTGPAAFPGASTLVDSFDPANDTFDTDTNGWLAAAFSIKGKLS